VPFIRRDRERELWLGEELSEPGCDVIPQKRGHIINICDIHKALAVNSRISRLSDELHIHV
jgi:hypothetical protein